MAWVGEQTTMTVLPEFRMAQVAAALGRLKRNVGSIVRGKNEAIEMSIITLIAGGHLLIEDLPGVGKTTLARALARSLDVSFRRIQFTSDLLPSDVLGVSIFSNGNKEFLFKPGPIFSNIILADEINRATPKTQSALLEAMNEHQVTYDDRTYKLPAPFMVIATQNPFDHYGTFPLPESQMDRFFMRISMGYPPEAEERHIVSSQDSFELIEDLKPVLGADEIAAIQDDVRAVRVDESLLTYLMRIIQASRDSRNARVGASPRAAQILYRASQARALFHGRDYLVADDIKAVTKRVLAHRILPAGPAANSRESIEALLDGILDNLEVPI